MKEPRNWIFGACFVLIVGMAFLTLRELVVTGITPLGVISLFIVGLLAIGVGGALWTPPRR